MLECVVNVSEGRDRGVVNAIAGAAGPSLLDVHADPDHNRAVLTLAGPGAEHAARAVTVEGVRRIDLRLHVGIHPRLGAVDVVPFAPLTGSSLEEAVSARDRFARWAADELGVPCFLYGPERSLPDVRRHAFTGLAPDTGPPVAHPTAGAICAGARPVLVAYNVWLADGVDVATARRVAREIRGTALRALGLDAGGRAQVSMNLVDPYQLGPAEAYDAVATRVPVARAELVGLLPAAVLEAVPRERWAELDLGPDRTLPPAL
ncbi:MAG: glutamate formiminotransferase [Actinomycetota bacterium]|nr:glutamate formiminotransferase [Actinomycetota bacterium]